MSEFELALLGGRSRVGFMLGSAFVIRIGYIVSPVLNSFGVFLEGCRFARRSEVRTFFFSRWEPALLTLLDSSCAVGACARAG